MPISFTSWFWSASDPVQRLCLHSMILFCWHGAACCGKKPKYPEALHRPADRNPCPSMRMGRDASCSAPLRLGDRLQRLESSSACPRRVLQRTHWKTPMVMCGSRGWLVDWRSEQGADNHIVKTKRCSSGILICNRSRVNCSPPMGLLKTLMPSGCHASGRS